MIIKRIAFAFLWIATFCFSTIGKEIPSKTLTTENQVLFFDEFENGLTNWTTLSVAGDDVWHFSGDDGIDGGKCARFYITSNPPQANDDWLISKVINVEGISNIEVEFKYWFHEDGIIPEFYYTSSFNGDISGTSWIKLDNSFWENEWTWNNARIEIENPGENFVFAIRYQSTTSKSNYILIDNFKIESYTPPPPFIKLDSTQHFEFYSNIPGSSEFYLGMMDELEKQFNILASIWEKPESSINIFEKKIKVYYSGINDIYLFDENTPDWKSGFYDDNNYSIYLSPIDKASKSALYSDINVLAVSELSQLFLSVYNKLHYSNDAESNFIECFGLYETGLKPTRINVNDALGGLGHEPTLDDVRSLDKLSSESSRILGVSYVEACILGLATEHIYPYYSEELWKYYLYYFYQIDESIAIRLAKQTDHINIYCVPDDDNYKDHIANKLEELFIRFTETYELNIQHPTNIIIYPNEKTGMDLNNREFYPGGIALGTDNYNMLSPNVTNNDLEVLDGFLGHEFFHIIHFNMISANWIPYAKFYMEGLADFMGTEYCNPKLAMGFYQIPWMIKAFNTTFQRDPTMEEIMANTYQDNPAIGYIDPYLLGSVFYKYLIEEKVVSYMELKTFFETGADWNAFQSSYDEIDKGYILYIKRMIGFIPPDNLTEIPYEEPFDDFEEGWTKPNYNIADNWEIAVDRGLNGGNCAVFYTYSDQDNPIKSWLISPTLNAKDLGKVVFSFDYSRYGDGSELEIFSTSKFDGDIEKSNWNSLKKISLTGTMDWKNTGEITLVAPPDTLFIGIRYSSPGEQHQQVYIDNFNVKDRATELRENALNNLDFNIFPNPITYESVISFQTITKSDINLSIYDLQGKKIYTLIDKNLNQGFHSIPVGGKIQVNGVYFCRLSTNEGVSTLKLIVNSN